MPIESIHDLHEATCRLLSRSVESILDDGAGTQSFNLLVDGLHASVSQSQQLGRDRALVIVNLGKPHARHEHVAVNELLTANFAWMTQHAAPVGSCNALTGELCVQFYYPYAQADGENLLARLEGIAAWSAHRRQYGELEAASLA